MGFKRPANDECVKTTTTDNIGTEIPKETGLATMRGVWPQGSARHFR